MIYKKLCSLKALYQQSLQSSLFSSLMKLSFCSKLHSRVLVKTQTVLIIAPSSFSFQQCNFKASLEGKQLLF